MPGCSRIAPPPSTIRRTSPSQMLHRRPMSPLVAPRNALSVFTSSPVLGLPFKSPPLGKCLPQSTQETLTHLFLQQKPGIQALPKAASLLAPSSRLSSPFLQERSQHHALCQRDSKGPGSISLWRLARWA